MIGAFAGLLVHQRLLQIEIDRTGQAAELARARKTSPMPTIATHGPRSRRFSIATTTRISPRCHGGASCATQAEKALIFYDRLLDGAESRDPVVMLDTARAAREAAMAQYAAGRFHEAVASLERSVRLIDAVEATRPNDPEVMRQQVQSRTKLGMLLWQTRKSADKALAEARRRSTSPNRSCDLHRVPSMPDQTWPGVCTTWARFCWNLAACQKPLSPIAAPS